MSRKTDREIVYQMLFSSLFNVGDARVDFEQELSSISDNTFDNESYEYISTTYNGVLNKKDELNKIIEPYLNGFELKRLYKTDYVALLLAVYELKYNKEIPTKVVINEVVELCKKFSAEKSAKYVNGVIASIIKESKNNEWKCH